MNNQPHRWVGIFRTSTSLQSEKSIPDQQQIVGNFTAANGMIPAGEDRIDSGVSASKRRERDDIDQLIERKKTRNDFNAIVVHDYSRLTRRGADDASEIERKLNRHGIRVFSATEPIPEGPYKSTMKSMLHTQHQLYARDLSLRSARGAMSSILMGRSTGIGRSPLGIDRLYSSLDGSKKHHIMRQLGDGSQVKLDPNTKQVIELFEKVTGEASRCYRRQDNEKVTLIPGDEKALNIVRRIFRMVIIEGVGYQSVAKTLHLEGIPTAAGGKWSKSSIKRIVTNPIYTGRRILNRMASGEFSKRHKDGPIAVAADELDVDRKISVERRPKSDWIIFVHEELESILDPELRKAAIEYQDRVMTHDIELGQTNHGIGRDKHAKSSFFLKDVLKLKLDGTPMAGAVVCQRKKRRIYRYYKPRGFGTMNAEGRINNDRIPAEPLEAFVLGLLMRVLGSAPQLRDELSLHVARQQELRNEAKTHVGELTAKRSNLRRKLSAFADLDTDDDFDDGMAKRVNDMRSRLRELDRQIEAARAEVVDEDPWAIADSIVEGLTAMGTALSTATPHLIRQILFALVESMECDPRERRAWLTLRIPSWAMNGLDKLSLTNVCLGRTSVHGCVLQANFPLGTGKMRYLLGHGSAKGSLNLANYRFCITDGPLASLTEHIPTATNSEALCTAAFEDIDADTRSSLDTVRPRRHKDYVAKIPSDALPYDWRELELSYQPLPQTWSYWTPVAIAA